MNRQMRRAGRKTGDGGWSEKDILGAQRAFMRAQYGLHCTVQAVDHPLCRSADVSKIVHKIIMSAFASMGNTIPDDEDIPWLLDMHSYEKVAETLGLPVREIRRCTEEIEAAGLALFEERNGSLMATLLPSNDRAALWKAKAISLDDGRFEMLLRFPFPPYVVEAVERWKRRHPIQ